MRDSILDVAEQLFSTAGYAEISFRDIASQAAVNPALISYYFGSKRALFEAVYKRRGKELTDRWARIARRARVASWATRRRRRNCCVLLSCRTSKSKAAVGRGGIYPSAGTRAQRM